jgi:signal transduction histidine kinase
LLRNAANGRDVPVLANSAPLREADGPVDGAVVAFQDITAIKMLERQREDFLAVVTHDLKNPLTSIAGMSEMLKRHCDRLTGPERDRFDRGLGTILKSAHRMESQINELLDVTRLQMGQSLELEAKSTDLVALVGQLLTEYRQTTERHTLRLQTELHVLVIMVDPKRLQRALANLLANAIKYSPQGGDIVVTLARQEDGTGEWIVIRIADHGVGIPASDQIHLFEPYYRASNVAGRITGTGLGLRGSRQIIEQHGGTISLESNEGTGTQITIRLPLTPPGEGAGKGES